MTGDGRAAFDAPAESFFGGRLPRGHAGGRWAVFDNGPGHEAAGHSYRYHVEWADGPREAGHGGSVKVPGSDWAAYQDAYREAWLLEEAWRLLES